MTKQDLVLEHSKIVEFLGWALRHSQECDKAWYTEHSTLTACIEDALKQAYRLLADAAQIGEGPC
jgi:hypothetical protein